MSDDHNVTYGSRFPGGVVPSSVYDQFASNSAHASSGAGSSSGSASASGSTHGSGRGARYVSEFGGIDSVAARPYTVADYRAARAESKQPAPPPPMLARRFSLPDLSAKPQPPRFPEVTEVPTLRSFKLLKRPQTSSEGPKPSSGSLNIIIATLFLQSIGFTIILPSMWPYLQTLRGTQAFFGWVVASYSIGQAVASPVVGWWSNRRPQREALVVTLVLSALANIAYSMVGLLDHTSIPPQYGLLVSRLVVGLGAGNTAVCRAYASEATSIEHRTATMAKMSGAQGVGFVVGPAVGGLLAYIPSFNLGTSDLPFNEYTSVGYLSGIVALINLLLVIFLFEELKSRELARAHGKQDLSKKTTEEGGELMPIVVSIFMFFIIIGVFAVFETEATIITASYYGWTTRTNSLLFTGAAVLSVFVYITISLPFFKRFQDRVVLLVAMSVLTFSLLMMSTWKHVIHLEDSVPEWQFLTGSAIMSLSYPVCSAMMYAIFSKVLNPHFQGTKMGWLTTGGSVSRIVGPLWASNGFAYGGGQLLFTVTAGMVVTAMLTELIFWKKLQPHPAYTAHLAQLSRRKAEEEEALTRPLLINENNNSEHVSERV